MKKIIRLAIAMLLMLILTLSASAMGENAQMAVMINLNETLSATFDDNDSYYFKFIPSETGWYEFSVNGAGFEDVELWLRDVDGEYLNYSDWNQYSNTNMVADNLKANNIYFLEIQNWGDYGICLNATIRMHLHQFEIEYISKATEYSNGYIENVCVLCGHAEEIVIPKIEVACDETEFIYNGETRTPKVNVSDSNGKVFFENKDFIVEYPKSSKDVDSYFATVTMENEYYDVYEDIFYTIEPKSINDLEVKLSEDKVVYGVNPTISISGLEVGKDFDFDLWCIGVGEQTAYIYGLGNYEGTKEITFTVVPAKVSGLKVSKTSSSYIKLSWKADKYYSIQYYQIYDVKKKKVIKTVSSDNLSYTIKGLKAGTVYDFKVRGYSKENGEKYYGEWTTITGVTNPENTSFNSLKSSKAKTFTAKWDKQSSATGYQIQYSTSSNFSNAKTVKITKNTSTSKTVSNLKSGKKYYVKIRTYKIVKVNGKSKTVYSSWSKAMSVKVK